MKLTHYSNLTLDNLQLPIQLKAANSSSKHIVIFVHGLFSDHENPKFKALSDRITHQLNMDCLLFSYRGHGNNNMAALSIQGAMYDFLSAYQWAVDRSYSKVSVICNSFGSSLVLNCLQDHPLELTKLVLLNPLVDYQAVPLNPSDIDQIQTQGYAEIRGIRFTQSFYDEFHNLKPYKADIEGFDTYIIQSKFDDRCPLSTLLQHYGAAKVKIDVVESDHAYSGFENELYNMVIAHLT